MNLNPITYIQITINRSANLIDCHRFSKLVLVAAASIEKDGRRDVREKYACVRPRERLPKESRRRVDDIMSVVNTPTARDSIDHHPTRAASRPLATDACVLLSLCSVPHINRGQ